MGFLNATQFGRMLGIEIPLHQPPTFKIEGLDLRELRKEAEAVSAEAQKICARVQATVAGLPAALEKLVGPTPDFDLQPGEVLTAPMFLDAVAHRGPTAQMAGLAAKYIRAEIFTAEELQFLQRAFINDREVQFLIVHSKRATPEIILQVLKSEKNRSLSGRCAMDQRLVSSCFYVNTGRTAEIFDFLADPAVLSSYIHDGGREMSTHVADITLAENASPLLAIRVMDLFADRFSIELAMIFARQYLERHLKDGQNPRVEFIEHILCYLQEIQNEAPKAFRKTPVFEQCCGLILDSPLITEGIFYKVIDLIMDDKRRLEYECLGLENPHAPRKLLFDYATMRDNQSTFHAIARNPKTDADILAIIYPHCDEHHQALIDMHPQALAA